MNVPERLAKMEGTLDRLDHTLNGNGQPGLAQKMEKFITEQYRLGDRVTTIEKNHADNKIDWQWMITAIIGAGAVIVAIVK